MPRPYQMNSFLFAILGIALLSYLVYATVPLLRPAEVTRLPDALGCQVFLVKPHSVKDVSFYTAVCPDSAKQRKPPAS